MATDANATEIRPALTPEEWRKVLGADGARLTYTEHERIAGSPHAQAALALHGQSYGFTREDAEDARREVRRLRDRNAGFEGIGVLNDDERAELARAELRAQKIAALLPPEG